MKTKNRALLFAFILWGGINLFGADSHYSEEALSYTNANTGLRIGATLTLPKGEGPFPIAILLQGSGPLDRDETLCNHKPFQILAHHLAEQNIASLRFDKRGVGQTEGNFAEATLDDFASDAIATVTFAKQLPNIDTRYIILMGHSEGGITALIAVTECPDVTHLILMATPFVNAKDLIEQQADKLLRSEGANAQSIKALHPYQKSIFSLSQQNMAPKAADKHLKKLLQQHLNCIQDKKQRIALMSYYGSPTQKEPFWYTSNSFRSYLTCEPSIFLRRINVPLLALSGDCDLFVPHKKNLYPINCCLEQMGHQNYTIRLLPHLNHMFQKCTIGTLSEYAANPETLSPAALNTISGWIHGQIPLEKKVSVVAQQMSEKCSLETLHKLANLEPQIAAFVPTSFRESLETNPLRQTKEIYLQDRAILIAEKTFEKFCQKTNVLSNHFSIPPTIHLIWLGSAPPLAVDIAVASWKKHHPTWEIKLWSDKQVNNFFWSHPRSEFLYKNAKNWAEKSDILRFEILYQFGGIYSDTDVLCLKPFDDLMNKNLTFFACLEENRVDKEIGRPLIGSAIIGATKGNPLLHACLDFSFTAQEAPHASQFIRSGPGPLSRAVYHALESEQQNLLILPCSYFYPLPWQNRLSSFDEIKSYIRTESFTIHFWEGSWAT